VSECEDINIEAVAFVTPHSVQEALA